MRSIEPRLYYVIKAIDAELSKARTAAILAKDPNDRYMNSTLVMAYADVKMTIAEALTMHLSDCATNNAPAYEAGTCDCGTINNEKEK